MTTAVKAGRPGRSLGRRGAQVAVGGIGLLVVLWWAVAVLRSPVSPQDEGQLLVYPSLVVDGWVPGRHFEYFYGPVALWLLALPAALLGPSVALERAVGLLYRLVLVLAVARIAERNGASRPAATVGAAGAVAATGVIAFAWLGGLCLLVLGQLVGGSAAASPRSRYAGLGLVALSVGFRFDLLPAALIVAVGILARGGLSGRRSALVVGAALAPVLWTLLLVGPRHLLILVETVVRVQSGRWLPIPRPADPLLFLTLVATALVPLALLVAARRVRSIELTVLGLMGLALLPQAVQRCDMVHIAFVATFLLPLAGVAGAALSKRSRVGGAAVTGAVLTLIWVGPFGHFARQWPALADSVTVRSMGRSAPVPPTLADDLGGLLSDVASLPASYQQLFVGPADLRRSNLNDTYVYYLLPRFRPASYFLEMNPGSANRRGSRLSADLRKADVVILSRLYDSWSEPNRSGHFGPAAPNQVVRQDFCPFSEHGPWQALIRRETAGCPALRPAGARDDEPRPRS